MDSNDVSISGYRGRLAPSPTGLLHLGHARTFWKAYTRAQEQRGALILRNEDLDTQRSKAEFVAAFIEDLHWLGVSWSEGPEVGGPFAPYNQSERMEHYRRAFEQLRAGGHVYPCRCSRKDIRLSARAPHAEDDEPVYPGTCRAVARGDRQDRTPSLSGERVSLLTSAPTIDQKANWRFRVTDGEAISFTDGERGAQAFVAGKDFGDFVVWRAEDAPSYQLAVVADDYAMQITEVVRGADLLVSTARQILLYRALGWPAPAWFHCPLMTDEGGVRLAKRHDALSLRALREAGRSPEELRRDWL